MIGIDLIGIDRIKKACQSKVFLDNTFSFDELEYAKGKGDFYQTLAGIFAAKEAVLKAVGTGIKDLCLNKVEIKRNENGQPHHKLDCGKQVFVSISHDGGFATAVAMIV